MRNEPIKEYIDRSAAENAIRALCPSLSTLDGNGERDHLVLAAQEMCAVDAVHRIPAAKVAPVRYARWVIDKESKHEKIAHCSHCGKRPVEKKYAVRGNGYVIYHCHAILTDFCPNCGAKMDGEERWNATTN